MVSSATMNEKPIWLIDLRVIFDQATLDNVFASNKELDASTIVTAPSSVEAIKGHLEKPDTDILYFYGQAPKVALDDKNHDQRIAMLFKALAKPEAEHIVLTDNLTTLHESLMMNNLLTAETHLATTDLELTNKIISSETSISLLAPRSTLSEEEFSKLCENTHLVSNTTNFWPFVCYGQESQKRQASKSLDAPVKQDVDQVPSTSDPKRMDPFQWAIQIICLG